MGQCASFKQKKNNHLINTNSIDKQIYSIEGILEKNINKSNKYKKPNFKNRYITTTIIFYEDYLNISNLHTNETISYYNIKSWSFNKSFHLWIFNNLNHKSYLFYINKNKYPNIDIGDKLSTIIKEHINYKNNLYI